MPRLINLLSLTKSSSYGSNSRPIVIHILIIATYGFPAAFNSVPYRVLAVGSPDIFNIRSYTMVRTSPPFTAMPLPPATARSFFFISERTALRLAPPSPSASFFASSSSSSEDDEEDRSADGSSAVASSRISWYISDKACIVGWT